VVWAAYTAAVGIPEHAEPVDPVAGCARCGHATTEMTAVGQVISRRFTGFESWTNLAGRHLCAVCVWVYRNRSLRNEAHIVTRNPSTLVMANPPLLLQVLSNTIDRDTAVIVPLRPGRKHLLPDARWGQITADDTHLTWSESDTVRLDVMRRLRSFPVDGMPLRAEHDTQGYDRRPAPEVRPSRAGASAPITTGNLPLELTSFVGRRHELTDAKNLLARSRLVTLTGIGGVGKTRLAMRVAATVQRDYADGVRLAELGELRDESSLVDAVAAAVGVRGHSARPVREVLIEFLAPRKVLLVLDNCEHMVDAVAELAETLLRVCPGLRILATSLCTAGEQLVWGRAAVFAGSFELEAAERVCGEGLDSHELLDTLTSLVEKSILLREENGSVVRFRILETLREYGYEKLEQTGEAVAVRRRHRDWYEALALDAEAEWISTRQLDWIARLKREQPNLREALEFSLDDDPVAGLRAAAALYWFWSSQSQLSSMTRMIYSG